MTRPSGSPSGLLDILYVGALPPFPGGATISCTQLLLSFARLGHRIRALAPITPETIGSGGAFAASHPALQVAWFLLPYFYGTPYAPAPDAYREVERAQLGETLPALIARERPDLILVGWETYTWHVVDLARARRIPCIFLARGHPLVNILHGTYPEDHARRALEHYRKFDLIVTPAAHMADGLVRLGFTNVKMIPNAIDLQQFSPRPKSPTLLRELAIRADDVVVLHASVLNPRKRAADVVASAERALGQHPTLVYVIVGDGPLRQAMEDTCRERRLLERFRFVGWVDYDRVPEYMNLADIVLMASETEGLARVYLEAQACARVLVASDIEPAREVIVDGDTGLLFPIGDIAVMTTRTLLAAGDPALRAEIGRKARERVRGHALEDAVSAYAGTFAEVVRQHCPS